MPIDTALPPEAQLLSGALTTAGEADAVVYDPRGRTLSALAYFLNKKLYG